MPTPPGMIVPYGLCRCGCGGTTPIAKADEFKFFRIKGFPTRYISGHNNPRQHPTVEDVAPFKIDGVYCRLIPLTQGLWTIVDELDYAWLMQWKWCAVYCPNTRGYYAQRMERDLDGKERKVFLHRLILGLKHGDPRKGDHKSKCGLDNRRKNLRPASHEENAQNGNTRRDNTSGIKDINWRKREQAWQVRVQAGKIRKHIGYFKEFEKARTALIEALRALHGEFASFD